jgi:SH3 domain-containing YSC84-like protein 1
MTAVSRRLFFTLPVAAASMAFIKPALALSDPQQLVETSRIAFLDMITDSDYSEMQEYVKQSRALLIFPQLVKGAFIIGGEGGSGVLVARGSGDWSYPAFYTLASGSLGFQIGGQVAEMVLTIMSAKALAAVIDNQFKIGGNIDVAAGPVGKGLAASTTTNLSADAYSFAKTQGLYAGVSLEGAGILKRDAWNEEYYGSGATPDSIVVGGRSRNQNADILRSALAPY